MRIATFIGCMFETCTLPLSLLLTQKHPVLRCRAILAGSQTPREQSSSKANYYRHGLPARAGTNGLTPEAQLVSRFLPSLISQEWLRSETTDHGRRKPMQPATHQRMVSQERSLGCARFESSLIKVT